MTKASTAPRLWPWDRFLCPSQILDEVAFTLKMQADSCQRQALAQELSLLELPALCATLTLIRLDADTIELQAHLKAEIVQQCAVSLEPLRRNINLPFALKLSQAKKTTGRGARNGGARNEGARVFDLDTADPPDEIGAQGIEVRALVIEQLVLAIDPYARAHKAQLPSPHHRQSPEDSRSYNPFSLLTTPGRKPQNIRK